MGGEEGGAGPLGFPRAPTALTSICGGCNATYYGKTQRHFKARICEHLGISHLSGKKDRQQ